MLERRTLGIPALLPIKRLLIVLPKEARSQVFINDEIEVRVRADTKWGNMRVGQEVSLHDLVDICGVEFNQIGSQDGWALMWHDGRRYQLWFDFVSSFRVSDDDPERRRSFEDAFLRFIWQTWLGPSLELDGNAAKALEDQGWWPAVALLPHPWAQMVHRVTSVGVPDAERCALDFFTADRLDALVSRWQASSHFTAHADVIAVGLEAYKAGNYIAAVSVLVPRVEGVLTTVALKHDQTLASLARHQDRAPFVRRIAALASTEGVIRSEAVSRYAQYLERVYFGRFDWRNSLAGQRSRSRHALAHGAQSDFDQVLALQAILALDSAFFLIDKSGLA